MDVVVELATSELSLFENLSFGECGYDWLLVGDWLAGCSQGRAKARPYVRQVALLTAASGFDGAGGGVPGCRGVAEVGLVGHVAG